MTRGKTKALFVCQECGSESAKWFGRCPACEQWNTLAEIRQQTPTRSGLLLPNSEPPQELNDPVFTDTERTHLPFPETNRVLGGGIVKGSLVLLAGDPGIGKSTFLLQIAASLATCDRRVLYVSGEESLRQVQLRAQRLGISAPGLFFVSQASVETILEYLDTLHPTLVIVDSIQAMQTDQAPGGAGVVTQVRECTRLLLQWAKYQNVPMIIAGHVTKDGSVAGPRVLEHMVDVVLYIEADPSGGHRLLRSVKNRFGSTNDLALFQMTGQGLVEISDPSAAFISQRHQPTVGSAVVVTMVGSRPMLAEVQALTTPSSFNPPRRTTNGVDFNRLTLVAAVLSRRAGLALANQDIIVNVTGGLRISEPGADLGIALAIASSLRDVPLDASCVYLGEVDLTGELRPVPWTDQRLAEATKLGFRVALLPPRRDSSPRSPEKMEIVPIATVQEALRWALPRRYQKASKSNSST